MTSKPQHYQKIYSRPLTEAERKSGMVEIKLDPYRISDALNLGGGAREQIMKKALRWTDKGDDIVKVINEIKQACNRQLEMLEEDGYFAVPPVTPPVNPSKLNPIESAEHDMFKPLLETVAALTEPPVNSPAASPWIKWTGLTDNECDLLGTPLPTGRVEVRSRNGSKDKGIASDFNWRHIPPGRVPGDYDIVKFRYIK